MLKSLFLVCVSTLPLLSNGMFRGAGVQIPDLVGGELAFALEAQPVAVGAEVVEAVVMHAHVGDVRRHALKGELARAVGVALLAGRIELRKPEP